MAVTDVLKLESRYVVYKKNYDGTINKEQYTLSTHSCGYKDFYYKYNDAVDYLIVIQYKGYILIKYFLIMNSLRWQ